MGIVDQVCLSIWRPDSGVVHVDKHPLAIRCCLVHGSLESLYGVGQSERCEKNFKQAKWRDNRRFRNVLLRDRNLVITFDQIHFGKNCTTMQPVRQILHVWKRIFVRGCDQI